MLATLEQVRIRVGDMVTFFTTNGNRHIATVIDASDPSLLRVELGNGNQLRVGRATVSLVEKKVAEAAA